MRRQGKVLFLTSDVFGRASAFNKKAMDLFTHGLQEIVLKKTYFLKTPGAGHAPKIRASRNESRNARKFNVLLEPGISIPNEPTYCEVSLGERAAKVNHFLRVTVDRLLTTALENFIQA